MANSQLNDVELKYLVHWPGKDVIACYSHLTKLVGLGAVLGYQINYTFAPEKSVCSNCESEAKRGGSDAERR